MILDCTKYTGVCECGHDHELRTKLVVCEYGALGNFDKYMDDCGLTGFRTVIYDTNTYNLPSMTHVHADQEIVLEAQGLHSEKGMIEDMMKMLTRKPDYIVTVGGGTLMDFARYSAYKLGIPFVIFLGEDEINAGVVAVKDMESGEQVKVSLDEAVNLIRAGLAKKNEGKVICDKSI